MGLLVQQTRVAAVVVVAPEDLAATAAPASS
jgi:hypothetical protein